MNAATYLAPRETTNRKGEVGMTCPAARVTYRGRAYTVVWVEAGWTEVSIQVERWNGMGATFSIRTVRPGPTRAAVLGLAQAARTA